MIKVAGENVKPYFALSAAAHWPFAILTTYKAMETRRVMGRVISVSVESFRIAGSDSDTDGKNSDKN